MDLIIGNYYDNIKCESFLDKETNRIRVRPLPNQQVPTTMVIDCFKKSERKIKLALIF